MTTTPINVIVRLGHGLEYSIVIQRGKGRNAEFIAGVHFGRKQTRRELRQWRDAIQRGIELNPTGQALQSNTLDPVVGIPNSEVK